MTDLSNSNYSVNVFDPMLSDHYVTDSKSNLSVTALSIKLKACRTNTKLLRNLQVNKIN